MERPDYRRIHELEYELGFREDPPPPRSFLDRIDEPGAVIEYNPATGMPSYDTSNPFGRAALLRRSYQGTRSADALLKSLYEPVIAYPASLDCRCSSCSERRAQAR